MFPVAITTFKSLQSAFAATWRSYYGLFLVIIIEVHNLDTVNEGGQVAGRVHLYIYTTERKLETNL